MYLGTKSFKRYIKADFLSKPKSSDQTKKAAMKSDADWLGCCQRAHKSANSDHSFSVIVHRVINKTATLSKSEESSKFKNLSQVPTASRSNKANVKSCVWLSLIALKLNQSFNDRHQTFAFALPVNGGGEKSWDLVVKGREIKTCGWDKEGIATDCMQTGVSVTYNRWSRGVSKKN